MNNYVVLDLEMCKTHKSDENEQMKYKHELIQIGAVALNDEYEIIDTFVTYVSPEYGSIDRFINRLTGISKKDTEKAPSAKQALNSFAAWLPENVQLIAWSNNDERQIKSELARKGIEIAKLSDTFGSWIDCQQLFGDKLNTRRKYRLSEALSLANIYYVDGAHDALVDARNTAKLFKKLCTEQELRLSPYLMTEDDMKAVSFNPFASYSKAKACSSF